MFKSIFLFFSSLLLTQGFSSDFSVDIQLLEPVNSQKIKLKVHVKNLSTKAVEILNPRRHDFKWEKINSLGNYIIEVEKFEKGTYALLDPSTIGTPIYQKEEYISLQTDSILTDTLHVSGRSFASTKDIKKGFPSGKYRLRVYFNTDMWNTNQQNKSNWIDFTIE